MITWLAIWIFWVIFTKESEWYPSTSDVSKKWLALVSWWYVVLYVHTYISKSGCVPQFANFESVMDHIIWKARPPTRPGRGGGEEDKKKLWKWTCQLYCDVIFWSGAHHTYVCVCVYVYVCQNRGYCGTYLLYKDILMQWRFRVKTCSVIFHATAYSLPDHLEHYRYSVKCFVVRTHSGRKYWYTC